ncbi:hypothetical protein Y032_0001g406 [Ancylostoma ceylanicum]|uniref:Uncharacterized protein n=1 Tax=Ancylostoma ceylanicum TaxID=53326 RepID=A0A016W553_9BILA|nr:hypothetical protein Y032_0001g406 [Ancylostoma ceylanicum]
MIHMCDSYVIGMQTISWKTKTNTRKQILIRCFSCSCANNPVRNLVCCVANDVILYGLKNNASVLKWDALQTTGHCLRLLAHLSSFFTCHRYPEKRLFRILPFLLKYTF